MKTPRIVSWLLTASLGGTAFAATVTPLPSPPSAVPAAPLTATVTPGHGPQILFGDRTFDFGRTPAGTEIRHDFEFVNSGDQMLEIRSVQTSCGCTTAADYEKTIAPGAKGRIPVILRTSGFTGPLHKTITVNSTAAKEPTVVLQLKGEAWVPVAINPPYLYFPQVTGGKPAEPRTARIVSNVETPLHILSTEVEPESFQVSLRTIVDGKEYELEARPAGKFKPGSTQGVVRLRTNQKDTPQLEVKLYLNVVQAVVATPSHLILPPGSLPSMTKRYLSIRANDGNLLAVSEAEVSGHPDVTVALTETLKGRMFRVEVTFPAGFTLAQGQSPSIVVKTSHPDYPELKIPVVQPQRAAITPSIRATTASSPRVLTGPVPPAPAVLPARPKPFASPVPDLTPAPPPARKTPTPPLPPAPPRSR